MNGDLEHGGKTGLVPGLHRICPAQDTLRRILPIKHRFGITRIANVTGLDRVGLPVVIAMRPNARSIAVSQGKGFTLDQAKASATMEAIEIWHAENFDKPVFFASFADLSRAHRFVDLDRLPAVPGGAPSHTERLHWVTAVDLIGGQEVLVPLEMVHADYTHPLPPDAGRFAASTNGLASGNHRLEAICHGVCEVIERDALAVWHHLPPDRQRKTRLALDTVEDARARDALGMFAGAGLDCLVWDVTSDIGVASVLCVVREPGGTPGHVGLGSGTHTDRGVALLRALTEAAQTRLNYISGAREDLSIAEFTEGERARKSEAFAGLLEAQAQPRSFGEIAHLASEDLETDLECLKDRLQRAGTDEIAVVDLTRPEFGIPVVRVIIPGLEAPHDDESYVAGPRALRAASEGAPA